MPENIYIYVLISGLAGLAIGWFLRGFASGKGLEQSRAEWQGKVASLEAERTRLAGEAASSEKAAADVRQKLAAMEGALAARASAWDAERAKLVAEQEAAADAQAAKDAAQAAQATAMRSEIEGLRGRLALAESAAADAQAKAGQIERDSVASAKSAKDWAGKFGALQNEHLALREEVKRASAGDGDLKAVVDSLRKRAKDAEERLALTMRQKAESAAKAEAEVTGLRGQIAELENAKLAEAARTSDEAGALREELSHHEITIRVQQSRISELEAGLAKMESA